MRVLIGTEETQAKKYFEKAAEIAKKATCTRAKCGTVIVKNGEIIGNGYNSPPNHLESQRRCKKEKEEYSKKITDKTCCIHAEQRAIIDALTHKASNINGATLYFTRINAANETEKSGNPYCTICSKMALDVGIKEFVLWHESGITAYDTNEYNSKSYDYQEQ
jgi:deoxycytidylate deaminase